MYSCKGLTLLGKCACCKKHLLVRSCFRSLVYVVPCGLLCESCGVWDLCPLEKERTSFYLA